MHEIMRLATPDDLPAVARLLSHSFPLPGRGAEGWAEALRTDPRGGPELLWVCEDDGELTATCHLLRFEQWIAGAGIPVMGLGKVAVAPTHRRRGLGRRLVASALRHARERGDLATALYPFRSSFYAGLGYAMAGRALQYRLPAFLPDAPERGHVRVAESDEDRAAVREVYSRWIRGETGQLSRDPRAWDWYWASRDHRVLLYQPPGGAPEGYALLLAGEDASPVQVEERAWLTPRARRGIYGWLSALAGEGREVLYRAPAAERVDLLLPEESAAPDPIGWGLWRPVATVMAGPMFRLLDVPEALRRRTVVPGPSLSLRLEVPDAEIPANRGPWAVTLDGGTTRVEPCAASGADLDLSLPVAVLSGLYVGALRLADAVEAGLAHADPPTAVAALDRALAVPPPWTFTRF